MAITMTAVEPRTDVSRISFTTKNQVRCISNAAMVDGVRVHDASVSTDLPHRFSRARDLFSQWLSQFLAGHDRSRMEKCRILPDAQRDQILSTDTVLVSRER